MERKNTPTAIIEKQNTSHAKHTPNTPNTARIGAVSKWKKSICQLSDGVNTKLRVNHMQPYPQRTRASDSLFLSQRYT